MVASVPPTISAIWRALDPSTDSIQTWMVFGTVDRRTRAIWRPSRDHEAATTSVSGTRRLAAPPFEATTQASLRGVLDLVKRRTKRICDPSGDHFGFSAWPARVICRNPVPSDRTVQTSLESVETQLAPSTQSRCNPSKARARPGYHVAASGARLARGDKPDALKRLRIDQIDGVAEDRKGDGGGRVHVGLGQRLRPGSRTGLEPPAGNGEQTQDGEGYRGDAPSLHLGLLSWSQCRPYRRAVAPCLTTLPEGGEFQPGGRAPAASDYPELARVSE